MPTRDAPGPERPTCPRPAGESDAAGRTRPTGARPASRRNPPAPARRRKSAPAAWPPPLARGPSGEGRGTSAHRTPRSRPARSRRPAESARRRGASRPRRSPTLEASRRQARRSGRAPQGRPLVFRRCRKPPRPESCRVRFHSGLPGLPVRPVCLPVGLSRGQSLVGEGGEIADDGDGYQRAGLKVAATGARHEDHRQVLRMQRRVRAPPAQPRERGTDCLQRRLLEHRGEGLRERASLGVVRHQPCDETCLPGTSRDRDRLQQDAGMTARPGIARVSVSSPRPRRIPMRKSACPCPADTTAPTSRALPTRT